LRKGRQIRELSKALEVYEGDNFEERSQQELQVQVAKLTEILNRASKALGSSSRE
jgi:hypothetical protein